MKGRVSIRIYSLLSIISLLSTIFIMANEYQGRLYYTNAYSMPIFYYMLGASIIPLAFTVIFVVLLLITIKSNN